MGWGNSELSEKKTESKLEEGVKGVPGARALGGSNGDEVLGECWLEVELFVSSELAQKRGDWPWGGPVRLIWLSLLSKLFFSVLSKICLSLGGSLWARRPLLTLPNTFAVLRARAILST